MRDTPIRKNILKLLDQSPYPLSVNDLRKHIEANKTTIYRQLDSLTREGLVNQVHLSDRKVRYEPTGGCHHHHLVCEGCGVVKDVPLDESILLSQLKKIKDFKISRHSLEFFGLCNKCFTS